MNRPYLRELVIIILVVVFLILVAACLGGWTWDERLSVGLV